jgi:hypothetical protein
MVSTKRKTKQQLALDCTPRHAHLRCTKTAGDRDQSGDQLLTPPGAPPPRQTSSELPRDHLLSTGDRSQPRNQKSKLDRDSTVINKTGRKKATIQLPAVIQRYLFTINLALPRLVLSPKSQVTRIPHAACEEGPVLIEDQRYFRTVWNFWRERCQLNLSAWVARSSSPIYCMQRMNALFFWANKPDVATFRFSWSLN